MKLKTIHENDLQEINIKTLIFVAQRLPYEGYAIWNHRILQINEVKIKKFAKDAIDYYNSLCEQVGMSPSDNALADYEFLKKLSGIE